MTWPGYEKWSQQLGCGTKVIAYGPHIHLWSEHYSVKSWISRCWYVKIWYLSISPCWVSVFLEFGFHGRWNNFSAFWNWFCIFLISFRTFPGVSLWCCSHNQRVTLSCLFPLFIFQLILTLFWSQQDSTKVSVGFHWRDGRLLWVPYYILLINERDGWTIYQCIFCCKICIKQLLAWTTLFWNTPGIHLTPPFSSFWLIQYFPNLMLFIY